MIPEPTFSKEAADAWRPALFGFSDADILQFYHAVGPLMRPGACCVEVGVAFGRGVVFLAELLAAHGNRGANVYGIDPYRLADPADPEGDSPTHYRGALEVIVANASELELDLIHLVREGSLRASAMFTDASLDLVMIDGKHNYRDVKADIKAWMRKVRPGGLLAGHDFCSPFVGVIRAVEKVFSGRHVLFGSVWAVQIE
jgi:SAM-dependent methyltransferase